MKAIFFYLFLAAANLQASTLTALYATLDPTSISQHFAFYELYPNAKEGRDALRHAWDLLAGGCGSSCDPELILPTIDPNPIISLVNRSAETPLLNEEQLQVIEKLGSHLPNRKLKGHNVWTKQEVLSLEPSEIDLARALLIAESFQSVDAFQIRSYEASLDLMALQIIARLTLNATPIEKIRTINDYIFSELRFRFPPHSLYAKDIDLYTLLPAVIDSRRGVCLGVSILYLSLAQRLDLDLQAITPPGHIYVRYVAPNGDTINIETTARGIDIPSDMYLSLETRKLQQRNIKEVVGLAFMNQAAVAWHKKETKIAIDLYQRGMEFLPQDPLIHTFLGFQYLFNGEEAKGKELLASVKGLLPDHLISTDFIVEDYLSGAASVDGIRAIYQEVDETRNSILLKQKELAGILDKHPSFRGAIFHLAITHLQLGREKEAIPLLERYVNLDAKNPVVAYYLAALHRQRMNYNASWKYLKIAETIVHERKHYPKALEDLRRGLVIACPEPQSVTPL
ncbi:MAG TPA: transglutaminase family protein [Chlamydiales bacterium]|nr:transglutaminase family protein [Chlamydiales bacterium]